MKALTTLAVAALLLPGCGRKPEARPAAEPELATARVQIRTAESKPRATTEEVVGTIRAKRHATLEAKLSGRILEMPVLLGQSVKAGQLVARLDAAELKARLEQAEASLQQADRDRKRTSALLNQQAATPSESDTADSRYRVAKAALAEARAMLGYAEVLAPFDGVVTKKWADAGDLAAPGKPVIQMEDPTVLELEADVPEAIASRVQPDARLAFRVDSVSGELAGTVSEIAPTADSLSRTLRVKLALPPTPGLKSGQFGRLILPLGESSALRVPAAAVVVRGQLEILFVVANQRAQLHLVKTGKRIGDEVEILAGLEAGESVVVEGAGLLTDGQPVEAR